MGTPCVNVPGLVDAGGLPLGLQVIGRFGADRATLEAAQFVESALTRRGDGGAQSRALVVPANAYLTLRAVSVDQFSTAP